MLNNNSAYMLRNDGEIFQVKYHPTIIDKREIESPSKTQVIDIEFKLFDDDNNAIEWFYKHTQYNQTKSNIELLISAFCNYFNVDEPSFLKKPLNTDINYSFEEIQYLAWMVNDECNQEFCRIRTGGLYDSHDDDCIYFRISSVGFNWFNLIWKIAYDNHLKFQYITICKNEASFGLHSYKPYVVQTYVINNFPIEDFITLSGNPIVEKINFIPYKSIWSKLLNGENYSQSMRCNYKDAIRIREKFSKIDDERYYQV